MKQYKTVKTKLKFGLLKDLFSNAKDYIFPVFCLGCEREGEWLCDECKGRIDLSGVWCCPVCHCNTEGGICCLQCRDISTLYSEVAVTAYKEDSMIGKLIAALKYQYAEDVRVAFEKILNDFVANNHQYFAGIDYIVSIPLHKKRYAERGYNQAEIIAGILSDLSGLPLKKILKRERATKQQAKLKREERLKNLKDAFVLDGEIDLRDKRILLVDDVYTTGSTMGECASVFHKAGVKKVLGFTVARG